MRFGGSRGLAALRALFAPAAPLALALMVLVLAAPLAARAEAGAAPSAAGAPAPDAPEEGKTPPAVEAAPPDAGADKAAPGVPSEATAETLEVPARPVALIAGDSDWAEGFKTIGAALAKVQGAVEAAGLKPAGPPFAVFLSTDDASFHFEAMVPLAAKPDGKSELGDGVKLGESPSGKALKFLHRGAYDDIDSTYDLITAYLDEKGLDARNVFVEEYLTLPKESDDASLEADIYVFLK